MSLVGDLRNNSSWDRTSEIAAFEMPKHGFVIRQAWVNKVTGQKEWLAIPYFDYNGNQIETKQV